MKESGQSYPAGVDIVDGEGIVRRPGDFVLRHAFASFQTGDQNQSAAANFGSTCPPNFCRIADRTFSANVCC